MPIAADRVKDTTVNPSNTATITLVNSAPTGYKTFGASFAVGDRILYAISSATSADWETGYGVMASSTTLTRSNVTSNSAGTFVPLTFSAGTYDIFNTITASRHLDLITRGKTTAALSGLSVAV